MHLHEQVDEAVSAALKIEFRQTDPVRTRASNRTGFDRQYDGAMSLARKIGQPAAAVAAIIADVLRNDYFFSDVQVSGPGFVNMRIADEFVVRGARHAAVNPIGTGSAQRIMVDFGGPNIAKALHVGHLRSLVIGESLRRILTACGHDVESDIHLGDWGLPIGMLLSEITDVRPELWQEDDLGSMLERVYPEIAAACKTDENRMALAKEWTARLQNGDAIAQNRWNFIREAALGKVMLEIKRLGAHFDFLDGESDSAKDSNMSAVKEALGSRLRDDDGTLVVDVARPNDKKPVHPLIFRKGDGAYTYAASDLGAAIERAAYDTVLYVVDERQSLHLEQVFRAAKLFHDGELVHVGFGTVNGPDGRPYKTRDGGVPLLRDMLDAAVAKAAERASNPANAEIIGIGAVKFADLITNRHSGYVFDLDRIVEPEGKTGPYVQYACVRIKMILNQAVRNGTDIMICDPAERELLAMCAAFPEAVRTAEENLMPTYVAEYAFGLAQKFSQFYAACHVIGSPHEASRATICDLTGQILERCLGLLGIGVPERM